MTSSGTGAMEASIVNTLSPGDRVLALTIGSFGQRYVQIAEAFGADVVKLEAPTARQSTRMTWTNTLPTTLPSRPSW